MTNKKTEAEENDLQQKVKSIFEAYLEKQGLRKTPERFAVLHWGCASLYKREYYCGLDAALFSCAKSLARSDT